MASAIKISNLQKYFGRGKSKKHIINDISFDVKEGEIFGFIGPNGAGKSTIIKLLLQFYKPDSGSLHIFDKQVGCDEFRHLIGYLSEVPFFYEHLTARECLEYAAKFNRCNSAETAQRIIDHLEKMNLAGAVNQKIRTFSKGMKQRLGFAAAMVHDPPLYIFDEPMSGLDPMGRDLVKKIFQELTDAKKTIFFSTHILNDIEKLCSRIGLIHKGNLLYIGGIEDFVGSEDLDTAFVKKIRSWDNVEQK